jgi:hypothetical protein
VIAFLLQCYLDPLSGCKFYSKPQVFQYLKTLKLGSRTPIKRKPDIGLPLVSKVRSHKFSHAFFLYSFLFCNFVYWILLLSFSFCYTTCISKNVLSNLGISFLYLIK